MCFECFGCLGLTSGLLDLGLMFAAFVILLRFTLRCGCCYYKFIAWSKCVICGVLVLVVVECNYVYIVIGWVAW